MATPPVAQIAHRVVTVVDGRVESVHHENPADAGSRRRLVRGWSRKTTTRKALRDLRRQQRAPEWSRSGLTIMLGVGLFISAPGVQTTSPAPTSYATGCAADLFSTGGDP